MILNPAVLLLDEPLGALDAKLRKRLQIELKALQEEVGITFIYVTHDQEEALTMSDRIAVMSQGQVEQVGPPQGDLRGAAPRRTSPTSSGVSNLMEGTAEGQGTGGCRVTLGEFALIAGEGEADTRGASKITIRPERVDLEATGTTGENRVPGMVERVVYVGSILQVFVTLAPGRRIQAWIQNDGGAVPFASGTPVAVHMPREALRVLPDTGTPVSLDDRPRGRRGELNDAAPSRRRATGRRSCPRRRPALVEPLVHDPSQRRSRAAWRRA